MAIASLSLSDNAFLAAFQNCELPLSSFRLGDHLRLAWLQLHRNTPDQALTLVREGIRTHATHHGVSHIFHKTITTAWVKLLATHREPTFAAFIHDNECRLGSELLHRFWTPAALNSQTARSSWLPPDRNPLPN